ncbi:rod shape-determining protein RodA [Bacillus sp. BRMEA1]|uniref:FtsW/RodA/SpoVE family cell cycle protein n=1 Tax=Neobacillus endophyticus TaxID=2738405 RepID=UPI001566A4AE|nr:FtsW/RodA/SpoVE family cell cycle protein [Neobacillus endophyticus]NRD80119.1 rod shape-determining protein RodA [Neobacillus endophyticus]
MNTNTKSNFFNRLDGFILFIIFIFFILSLLFIYSSQRTGEYGAQNFAMKQAINYMIGFVILFLIAKLDIDQIQRLAWPAYITLFLSIIALKFSPARIAPVILGAKRWYSIPLLGSIQPSEYFKIALIILVASIITKHNSTYTVKTVKSDLLLVGKVFLVTIPPSIVVYIQPDTGMVFLYFIAIVSMLYLSGIQKKLVAVFLIVPMILVGILVYLYYYQPDIIYKQLIPLLSPHQQQRIIGWLNPAGNSNDAYQTQRSLLAVGSGETFGKGLLKGNVYIPEKHTDFIFSTVAEETGFFGASIVIILFFLLIYRIIGTGHESETGFGAYICVGISFSLTVQIFQNIGMVVGLMPVKGISLPFLTYGGSSLFSNMISMGIVLSIRKTLGLYMFKNKKVHQEEL